MTYGEPQIRLAVPLALGLISASRPQLPIIDALSKYSHDSDLEVAVNAIFAMGLVGAGTNNARLAQMLRQLAVYYATEPDCSFIVRIAQVSQTSFRLLPLKITGLLYGRARYRSGTLVWFSLPRLEPRVSPFHTLG
jgi:hypothetical protein